MQQRQPIFLPTAAVEAELQHHCQSDQHKNDADQARDQFGSYDSFRQNRQRTQQVDSTALTFWSKQ